jgi:hypothetical protein
MKKSGVASVTVLGMIGLLVALAAIGGFSYYKVDQLHQENLSIKSLLNTQNQASTTIDSNATTTIDTTTITASGTVQTSAATSNSDSNTTSETNKNYNVIVIAAIDQRIAYENEVISYFSLVSSYLDRYITMYKSMSRDTKNSVAGDTETGKFAIKYYDSTVGYIESVKAFPVGYTGKFQQDIAYWQDVKAKLQNSQVSAEDALLQVEQASNWSRIEQYRQTVNSETKNLIASLKEDDRQIEEAFAAIGSEPIVSYTSLPAPTIPAVKVPSITRTSCHLWGSTLSCDSYAY